MRAGSSGCSCAEEYLVKSLSSATRLESPLASDFLAGICEGTAPPQKVRLPPEKICMAWQRRGSVGAGLYNLGNKSFLNSILQLLTAESGEGARGRSRAVPAPAVPSSGPSHPQQWPQPCACAPRGWLRNGQRCALCPGRSPFPTAAPREALQLQLWEVPGSASPVATRPRTAPCHKARPRAGWS